MFYSHDFRKALQQLNKQLDKHVKEMNRQLKGQQKPGPTARSMEEVEEIIEEWRKWKANARTPTQEAFRIYKQWGSRSILSTCLRRYRAKYGKDSI